MNKNILAALCLSLLVFAPACTKKEKPEKRSHKTAHAKKDRHTKKEKTTRSERKMKKDSKKNSGKGRMRRSKTAEPMMMNESARY